MEMIVMDFAAEMDNMRIINNDRSLTAIPGEQDPPPIEQPFDADATLKWVARSVFQHESDKCKSNLVFQFSNYICEQNPVDNPEWFVTSVYNKICENSDNPARFFNYRRDVKHVTCKPQHMIIKVTFREQQKAEMFYKFFTSLKANIGCTIFPDRPLAVRKAKQVYAQEIIKAQQEIMKAQQNQQFPRTTVRLTWQNGYLYFGNKFIADLLPFFANK